jgi:hypothetical protein
MGPCNRCRATPRRHGARLGIEVDDALAISERIDI